jgi:hypothetical protein
MKKTKISFYFIFISLFTLITLLFSIVEKSYFSFLKPQKMLENNALLNEFNPNLDLTLFSLIEQKNKNMDNNFDYSIIGKENNKEDALILDSSPEPDTNQAEELPLIQEALPSTVSSDTQEPSLP